MKLKELIPIMKKNTSPLEVIVYIDGSDLLCLATVIILDENIMIKSDGTKLTYISFDTEIELDEISGSIDLEHNGIKYQLTILIPLFGQHYTPNERKK